MEKVMESGRKVRDMRLIDADALLEKAWDADTRIGYVQVVDVGDILDAPTVELEQKGLKRRYTEEELSVFAHGISLSLLSKRSAQHWRYDEDTATEIEFLERLYEKVGADIRGE